MYTYIVMERTQIYLTEFEIAELDRRARAGGTTRSHLIREAVERYLAPDRDPEAVRRAIEGVFGLWAAPNRERDAYVERLVQRDDRDRLARLWPDRFGPDGDADDPR